MIFATQCAKHILLRQIRTRQKRPSMRTDARRDISVATDDHMESTARSQAHLAFPAVTHREVGISSVLPLEDVTYPHRYSSNIAAIFGSNLRILQMGNVDIAGFTF